MLNWKICGYFISMLCFIFPQSNPLPWVRSVQFEGNEVFSDRELSKVINLKKPFLFSEMEFDKRVLKLDAITLKNKYKSAGYLNAVVVDSFQTNENLTAVYFLINEGQKFFINKIRIEGNQIFSEKSITRILDIKSEQPFNPILMNSQITYLEKEYQRKGKLFSTINIETEVTDSVNIYVYIQEGSDVYINHIYFEGADTNKLHLIKRDLYFHSGDKYDLDNILLSQKKLLETAQFSLTNIYPVKSAQNDTTVNLVVEVKYLPKREITSEGGFVPIEFGGLLLSGPGAFLQWKNRSMFGTSTRLTAKSSLNIPTESGLQYPKLKIDLNLENQWLFNLRFPTKVQSLYEIYKQYGSSDNPYIQRYGFKWSSINQFKDNSFYEFGLRWEKFSQQDETEHDVEQRLVFIKSKWDFSDNPLFPTRGIVFTGNVFGVGGILGGDREYQKFDLAFKTYNSVYKKVILAMRVQYGEIINWKNEYNQFEEILFEKFYLGGTKSLRAWKALQYPEKKELELIYKNGNTVRVLTGFEFRFPLLFGMGLECFLDGGQLSNHSHAIALKNMSWDAGTGITYQSPLGPVRLDYAYQIEHPQKWEILLDVLYAF